MNKELDKLLCLLDGKITAYRMKNPRKEFTNNSMELKHVQKEIQELWEINKNEYRV